MFLYPFVDYESEIIILGKWILRRSKIRIDNIVFFLHYNVTVSFLVASSILVTTGLYIGNPIECISDSSVQDVIDSFCWVHSTFTVPSRWNLSDSKEFLLAHPGVTNSDKTTHLKFHGYYQWISYILLIQAFICYVPRLIWKNSEGGRMQMLVHHADEYLSLQNIEDYKEQNDQSKPKFLQYFIDNLGNQNFYFRKLVFCEVLNLVFTIFQMYIANMTNLRYEDIFRFITINDPLEREDFFAQIFPKVTKCTFNVYGPSGNIQKFDALCVLPFNSFNEKIYIIIWAWLTFLAVLSLIVLVYRALLLLPTFRMTLLKHSTRYQDIESFNSLRKKLKIGDWFILYELGKNMDLMRFTKIINLLQNKLHE